MMILNSFKRVATIRVPRPPRSGPAAHVKRPNNAFFCFLQDQGTRQRITNAGIHCDIGNRTKYTSAASTLWHRLSAEEKAPFVERAKLEKERHLKDNPGYKYKPQRHNTEPTAPSARQLRLRQPNKLPSSSASQPPTHEDHSDDISDTSILEPQPTSAPERVKKVDFGIEDLAHINPDELSALLIELSESDASQAAPPLPVHTGLQMPLPQMPIQHMSMQQAQMPSVQFAPQMMTPQTQGPFFQDSFGRIFWGPPSEFVFPGRY